jgi:hypothetical protein
VLVYDKSSDTEIKHLYVFEGQLFVNSLLAFSSFLLYVLWWVYDLPIVVCWEGELIIMNIIVPTPSIYFAFIILGVVFGLL